MGMRVDVEITPELDSLFMGAVQRGLLSGAELVLAAAIAGAPEEPEPKHGVHMRDTGYTRLEGETTAEVGFTAYWAWFQENNLTYHHDVGHAKFTELALARNGNAALERVAASLSELFA